MPTLSLSSQQRSFAVFFNTVIVPLAAITLGATVARGSLVIPIFVSGALITAFFLTWKPESVILLWLMLAMGMQSWQGIEFGAGIPNITIDRYFLLLALVICVSKRTQKLGKLSAVVVSLGVTYSVYTLFLIATRAMSPRIELLNWFSATLLPMLTVFIGSRLNPDNRMWRQIAAGTPIVVSYLFFPAVYEQITQRPFLPSAWISGISFDVEGVRSASLAGGPVALAFSVALLAPFMILSLGLADTKRQRIWRSIMLMTNLGTAFFAGFRSAWVSASVVLTLGIFLVPQVRRFLIGVLITGILVFGVFSTQILTSNYMVNRVLRPDTVESRLSTTQEQLERASQNLLFGEGGIDAWEVLEVSRSGSSVRSSHNTYLSLLLYYGLIGLLLYGLIIGLVFYATFLMLRNGKRAGPEADRTCFYMLALTVGSFIWIGFSQDNRYFATNNCLVGLAIGLAIQTADKLLSPLQFQRSPAPTVEVIR